MDNKNGKILADNNISKDKTTKYLILLRKNEDANMNIVEIENVTKTFGKYTAVDSLSLNVPQGSVYGFIGPNGSGKTTTLRMIMNILYPDTGMIKIFGEKHKSCTDRIGYMPEERGLYKKMKVVDVLRFYGELKSGRKVNKEVDYWLERLDLADWGNKKIEALSKGMSQKVQFIATVVANPELVILDEPLSGLDPVNADVIKDAILELRAKGTTIIFSTHDMSFAERMCDFIFMLFKGRKVLDGTLESIQGSYGNDVIRLRVEGDINDLHNVKGIEKVSDFGQVQELRVSHSYDPHDVLKDIMLKTRVKSFELAKPSLYDIFLRIAGTEAKEYDYAQNTQIS
jgi:ABC-2 type transport system ATP-binding protein